ncbi:hypothetical protein HID58_017716, partial [Brassica napus]
VKLQKHNYRCAWALRYKNRLPCASRILQTEGVYFPSLFYNSPLDCAVLTVKNKGYKFSGDSATLLWECDGNAVFLPSMNTY